MQNSLLYFNKFFESSLLSFTVWLISYNTNSCQKAPLNDFGKMLLSSMRDITKTLLSWDDWHSLSLTASNVLIACLLDIRSLVETYSIIYSFLCVYGITLLSQSQIVSLLYTLGLSCDGSSYMDIVCSNSFVNWIFCNKINTKVIDHIVFMCFECDACFFFVLLYVNWTKKQKKVLSFFIVAYLLNR